MSGTNCVILSRFSDIDVGDSRRRRSLQRDRLVVNYGRRVQDSAHRAASSCASALILTDVLYADSLRRLSRVWTRETDCCWDRTASRSTSKGKEYTVLSYARTVAIDSPRAF